MKLRMAAYEKHHGRAPGIGYRFKSINLLAGPADGVVDLKAPPDLGDAGNLVRDLRALGFARGVLVIDTMAEANGGIDENSAEQMGAAIAAVKALVENLECLVIVVHHAGKDPTKGLRGHSSLLAALDTVIEVTAGDEPSWKVVKNRDGTTDLGARFRLLPIPLGRNSRGQEMSSCVVVPVDGPAAPAPSKAATRPEMARRAILAAIGSAVIAHPRGAGPFPGIPQHEFIELAEAEFKGLQASRRKGALRALNDLLSECRVIRTDDGLYRFPAEDRGE
jgi:hypothetical protein